MQQDNISNKIKELRLKNKLTQAQLAEKLGVTFQAVSKWENAINIPDIALLNEIALLFNIDINELINGEKKQKKISNIRKLIFTSICLIIFIVTCTLMISKDFNFTNNMKLIPIATSSVDFEISGSLVTSNNLSVIHVSNIRYIGEKQDEIYNTLNFKLIEDNVNSLKIIDEVVIKDNDITLEEVVNKISFKVENYLSNCETFNCNRLYIKVYGIDNNGKTINFEIPFISIDNCTCEN